MCNTEVKNPTISIVVFLSKIATLQVFVTVKRKKKSKEAKGPLLCITIFLI